jgi:hypothetical protein
MSITTAIATVTSAAETAKKLYELSKSMQHVELKTTIAELMNELADAKIQLAELKEEIVALKADYDALKATKERETEAKPNVQWGCYKFEGDENLYCPACYDTEGKKHLISRVGAKWRLCSVCQRTFGV